MEKNENVLKDIVSQLMIEAKPKQPYILFLV